MNHQDAWYWPRYRARSYKLDGARWVEIKPFMGWYTGEIVGQFIIEPSYVSVPADRGAKSANSSG